MAFATRKKKSGNPVRRPTMYVCTYDNPYSCRQAFKVSFTRKKISSAGLAAYQNEKHFMVFVTSMCNQPFHRNIVGRWLTDQKIVWV
jgi:hypothetical protein